MERIIPNYTGLFIPFTLHFLYHIWDVGVSFCIKAKFTFYAAYPFINFLRWIPLTRYKKNTQSKRKSLFIFSKIKGKSVETTSNQTLISLVSFIIHNTWTGSKESLSWWWRWIRRSWKNNHIINLCNFI